MQKHSLTRMDKAVINDYYHMTTMDESMNWMKLTHLMSTISPNLLVPFCTFHFTSKLLIDFLNIHSEEK